MEYFAGLANGTRAARLRGAQGVRLDITYFDPDNSGDCTTNFMDITTPAGMA